MMRISLGNIVKKILERDLFKKNKKKNKKYRGSLHPWSLSQEAESTSHATLCTPCHFTAGHTHNGALRAASRN